MTAKILIVDDEQDLQELVRRKFRREIRRGEFIFSFAGDGVEALEQVRADPEIELVVSDINMPRMDGLTLLDELGPYEEQLKTLIISAYGDMDNIRAAMNRGAFDFVTKPIDFHDLLITMKRSLDQLDVLKEAMELRSKAEQAQGNLARYFPPHIARELATRDQPFGPPREQAVGVLFADIRDFTAMSEAMAPAEVLEMLRGFHGLMEAVVFKWGGTLEKYIGDALLATFGVPETGARDAGNALFCAREMLTVLADWNAERRAEGLREIGVGIGLHYGPAVLGDIGSERCMAFAVIGDTINTASRLQSLTRGLDTDLVVSAELMDRSTQEDGAADDAAVGLSFVGEQRVKGRNETVRVFTLSPSV